MYYFVTALYPLVTSLIATFLILELICYILSSLAVPPTALLHLVWQDRDMKMTMDMEPTLLVWLLVIFLVLPKIVGSTMLKYSADLEVAPLLESLRALCMFTIGIAYLYNL